MQGGLTAYKLLRIYSHKPLLTIFNLLLCNRLLSSKTIMRNAASFYGAARYLPGKTITDWLINRTISRAFTAGQTVPEMQSAIYALYSRGISPIVQYLPAVQSQGPLDEDILQSNAVCYRRSSDATCLHPHNYYSIKTSALLNMDVLKKYNRAIEARDRLWANSCQNGQFSSYKLFDNLQNIYRGLTQDDYSQYLTAVHGYTGNAADFTIDELSFRLSHRPYFLYQEQKNENLVNKILFPLNQQERRSILNFKSRLDYILKANSIDQNCPKVIFEAEQSNIQKAVDDLYMQNQQQYNKQRLYVVNSLKNVNQASEILGLQMEQALREKLNFGINLMSGGGQAQGLDNLLSIFKAICTSDLRGQILVSEHNEKHIEAIFTIRNRYPSVMQVHFAQYNNIGDHLTSYLKVKRESVHKIIPWGENKTIIPYFLYRSNHIAETALTLSIQYSLLKHELLVRAFGP